MLLGVDVGGTFTDAVLAGPGGRLHAAKTLSTPSDQSVGVMRAIELALASAAASPGEVTAFAHGTTVATNALLEGRGARTALVATDGFTDIVELGRQARAELYRLCAAGPPALVPLQLRFGLRERTGPSGPIRSPEGLDQLIDRVEAGEVEAIAVVLLHAAAHPAHEVAVGEALAKRLPGIHVSLSHQVSAVPREYERAATTEIDAALSPLLRGYLDALSGRCHDAGLPAPSVMQSSGGLTSAAAAAAHGAFTVLSGPAGGAGGAALLAAAAGVGDVLCFDMGGTSCDVCVIDAGEIRESDSRSIAGRPLALPSLDIETVGAGGGSIGWRDAGGALRVGPRSAGSAPGPAAYGRGGREPTVTDAHVVLGHLPRGVALADGVVLDHDRALAAVAGLAAQLGLEPLRAAAGILAIADAEMLGALRAVTVARGVDPRRYTLMPFGGAGPLHATAIADALGITQILCPRTAGVLSALGLAAAAPRRDATGAFEAAAVGPLRARAREHLGVAVVRERVRYALRYRGQSFELRVDAPPDADAALLRERFEAAHERHYGYRDPAGEVELVTVTVSVWGAAPAVAPRASGALSMRTSVPVWHAGELLEATLLLGAPAPGERLAGPAICALADATLLVTPGWRGAVREDGTIALERP
jgi:N-methylhydantoinase A